MLNYYLAKMPVLAQRKKNEIGYLANCIPVRFKVLHTDHINSGNYCANWPSSNTPPSGLAITPTYCPDGEHNLDIEFKERVVTYDPSYNQ